MLVTLPGIQMGVSADQRFCRILKKEAKEKTAQKPRDPSRLIRSSFGGFIFGMPPDFLIRIISDCLTIINQIP